jgi:hypothetical protein
LRAQTPLHASSELVPLDILKAMCNKIGHNFILLLIFYKMKMMKNFMNKHNKLILTVLFVIVMIEFANLVIKLIIFISLKRQDT